MLAGATALALLVAIPLSGAAQTNCTQETLAVRGAPLTVAYCVAGPAHAGAADELIVPVLASFGSPGGTFSRAIELHFVAGERVSRVMDSVDLRPAGMQGMLHLTLAYAGGLVRVEGAMLTPGAITIK
jgi:hypothetical protein